MEKENVVILTNVSVPRGTLENGVEKHPALEFRLRQVMCVQVLEIVLPQMCANVQLGTQGLLVM